MIEVEHLTKRYGSVVAVDRLSFQVGRGEIVGLLGTNGAGKTTTMRMLTTFLTPTSGKAVVSGHDVLDDPIEVRRKVGYLPENVPLYSEMRVVEYLRYRSQLKDVPRRKRNSAVDESLSRCGLIDVSKKLLGHLSKGYRQRVGLADSLLHDPDLLILDEPTAGLDPIQIREVRALIRDLGERHTILLSTHIMPEVEAVCGRVLIIAKGKLAVDESLETFRSESAIVVEVRGPAPAIKSALETVAGVVRVTILDTSDGVVRLELRSEEGRDLREAVAEKVVRNGWGLRSLDIRRSSLEDRFVKAVHAADEAAEALNPSSIREEQGSAA